MDNRIFKLRNASKPVDPNDPICPCCNYQGPFSTPSFRNQKVQCPKCGSLERQRFVYLAWSNHIHEQISQNSNILHISNEKSIQTLLKRYSKPPGLYRCCELNPKKHGVLNIDITRIPDSIHSIDLIYASHILEHIVDDYKALSELYRILKPDGLAIILVPQKFTLEQTYEDNTITSPEDRLKHFGDKDHVRYYGLDFIDRLSKTGFVVDIIAPKNFTINFTQARKIIYLTADEKKNILSNDIIYLCYRPLK